MQNFTKATSRKERYVTRASRAKGKFRAVLILSHLPHSCGNKMATHGAEKGQDIAGKTRSLLIFSPLYSVAHTIQCGGTYNKASHK